MSKNEPTLTDIAQSVDGIKIFLEENVMDALRDHDRRFDGLEARMDGMEGRMDGMEGKMDGMEGKMDGMEGKIDGLEKNIERLEQHVEQIEDDVAQIKKDTSKIPALDIVLTHTEATVENHEQRIIKLEGKPA